MKPVLEGIWVNAAGYRASSAVREIDAGLLEHPMYRDTALFGIHPSPDGARLVLEVSGHEMIFPHLLDLASGQILPEFETAAPTFYAWSSPDSFLGRTAAEISLSPNTLAKVNLSTGAHELFTYPDWEGARAEVNAVAVSPTGQWVVDSVTYPEIYQGKHQTTTEIGVTQLASGSRDILCQTDGYTGAYPYSLKWSPDEQRMMWIAPDRIAGAPADQAKFWLWIADRQAKQCRKVAFLRTGPGYYFPGGLSAEWFPDGQSIIFIQGQPVEGNELAGNVFLFDVRTSQVRPVTHYMGETITFAQFLPDPSQLAFSIQQGEYGEIWAIGLDGSGPYPIAGPTTLDAPFALIEGQ